MSLKTGGHRIHSGFYTLSRGKGSIGFSLGLSPIEEECISHWVDQYQFSRRKIVRTVMVAIAIRARTNGTPQSAAKGGHVCSKFMP